MANTLSSVPWTIDEIISSLRCNSCYEQFINHWAPCIRRSAQVNLHHGLTSRKRQLWYLVMQFKKYLRPGPTFKGDEVYEFKGENAVKHHLYSNNSRKILPNLPIDFQKTTIITRGIFYFR